MHFYCRYAYSEDKGEDSEDEEAHSIVLVSTERNGSAVNVVEEDKRE